MLFINGFNRISGLSRTGLTFRAARFNEWINARFAFASAHELSESGMGEAAAVQIANLYDFFWPIFMYSLYE